MILKKFVLLTLVALSTAACDDKDNDQTATRPMPPAGYVYAAANDAIGDTALESAMLFYGSSTVESAAQNSVYSDGTARFEIKDEAGEIYLYMHATRFAAAMPGIEMRLTAPAIIGQGILTMAGASITPQNYVAAADEWVDNTKYTITKFKLGVAGTSCTVTFTCAGIFNVSYEGHLIVPAK